MKKIYILHGWAYSTQRWEQFVSTLEKKGFKITILKIPGLTAPLDEVWNIDDYIEWLSEVLDIEKGKIILLGHSNGGLISLGFSLKYPEKVEKLILIDSTGIYHKELPIRLKRFVFANAAKIGKKLTNSKALRKLLYKAAGEHDYENANPIMQKTMRNLIVTDYSQILKNLRIPTIIIWGSDDQVTPLKDGKFMKSEIKNSKLFVIDGAKHSPQHTSPEQTAEIVLKNL